MYLSIGEGNAISLHLLAERRQGPAHENEALPKKHLHFSWKEVLI